MEKMNDVNSGKVNSDLKDSNFESCLKAVCCQCGKEFTLEPGRGRIYLHVKIEDKQVLGLCGSCEADCKKCEHDGVCQGPRLSSILFGRDNPGLNGCDVFMREEGVEDAG